MEHVNFFIRHKKMLLHYASAPAMTLAVLAGGFVLFRPDDVSWQGFFDYFFSSPLSMALEFVTALAMISYYIRHRLYPLKPRYRGYFVAGAFVLGLVAAGIYNSLLSQTAGFASFSGVQQFFAVAAVFYCIYRLVILVPDRMKRWIALFLLSFLWLHLISSGYGVSRKLEAGFSCTSEKPMDLWQIVVYKDPLQRCRLD